MYELTMNNNALINYFVHIQLESPDFWQRAKQNKTCAIWSNTLYWLDPKVITVIQIRNNVNTFVSYHV